MNVQSLRGVAVLLVLLGCRAPSFKKFPNDPESPQSTSPTTKRTVTTTAYVIALVLNKHSAGPEISGFDQVSKIFFDPAYGPCARCHTSQWPLLTALGWPDFLKSKDYKGRHLSNVELGTIILDCIDTELAMGCTGDPEDNTDNVEFKMPSKYGFPSVSRDDVVLLKRWVSDGALENSSYSEQHAETKDFALYRLSLPELSNSTISSEGLIDQESGEPSIRLSVSRAEKTCQSMEIGLEALNRAKQTLASGILKINCFENEYIVPKVVFLK
ncbi:MAG: hypothetical protein NTV34_13490 [Proteobacteria bacterium]|nr:hypothetical protein [Pseudomonadota bacterium]